MTDLNALIERLSRATGPDRELDILIGYAVDLRGDDKHLSLRTSFDTCGMEMMLRMAESCQNIWRSELPRYTSSIDAAMTLVPEGCAIRREYLPSASWPHRVWVYRDAFMPLDDGSRRPVLGKTEAVALTSAALSARTRTATASVRPMGGDV